MAEQIQVKRSTQQEYLRRRNDRQATYGDCAIRHFDISDTDASVEAMLDAIDASLATNEDSGLPDEDK